MTALWQIRLKGLDGALDALIDDYEQFTLSKIVNGVGTFALRLRAADAKAALFVLDSQVEFWRRDIAQGLAWYKEAEYLTRGARYTLTREGAYVFEASGVAYNHLLKRRVIVPSQNITTSKTGAAETVIKAFVDEQAGPSSTRPFTDFTLEADGAGGNTVTMDATDKNLLETCQAIAAAGAGDYDVLGNGAAAFIFNWYDGQRGTDRSASVTFAPELGNMAEADLQMLRHDEINTILVGGQGAGTARATSWRTDATLTDDSTWNRCEQFVNASQETGTDGLDTAGDAELWQGRPQNQFSCTVLQLPGCYYGQHYNWGDLVTASFGTYSATKKIQSVTITVSANEAESIRVELVDP
jgi:hypothetical protein